MAEFFRKLFADEGTVAPSRPPEGKLGLTGKVAIPHGKGFTVLRRGVLQQAISASRSKEAA